MVAVLLLVALDLPRVKAKAKANDETVVNELKTTKDTGDDIPKPSWWLPPEDDSPASANDPDGGYGQPVTALVERLVWAPAEFMVWAKSNALARYVGKNAKALVLVGKRIWAALCHYAHVSQTVIISLAVELRNRTGLVWHRALDTVELTLARVSAFLHTTTAHVTMLPRYLSITTQFLALRVVLLLERAQQSASDTVERARQLFGWAVWALIRGVLWAAWATLWWCLKVVYSWTVGVLIVEPLIEPVWASVLLVVELATDAVVLAMPFALFFLWALRLRIRGEA